MKSFLARAFADLESRYEAEIVEALDERNPAQLAGRSGRASIRTGGRAAARRGGDSGARPRGGSHADRTAVGVTTWTTRAGEPRPFPIIPGHEFSGEVHGVGPGVNDVAVGEAVFGMNDFFGDGAQAEFCVARSADVAPKPTSIDHVTAAVVPISVLTAWQGLAERAKLARASGS